MTNEPNTFKEREEIILQRIKKHYTLKLGRIITDEEVSEIAANLLNLAKVMYGA